MCAQVDPVSGAVRYLVANRGITLWQWLFAFRAKRKNIICATPHDVQKTLAGFVLGHLSFGAILVGPFVEPLDSAVL